MGVGPMCWTSLPTGLSEWELGPRHSGQSPVGNCSKHGKCGSAPTQKGQWGVRLAGRTTSMDKFSSGESGPNCT